MLASSHLRRRRNLAATSALIPSLILRSAAIISSPTLVPSRSSNGEYCWACPCPAMGEEDWRIGEVDCWRTMVQGEVRGLGIGEVSALLIGLVPMEKDLTRGGRWRCSHRWVTGGHCWARGDIVGTFAKADRRCSWSAGCPGHLGRSNDEDGRVHRPEDNRNRKKTMNCK